MAAFPWDADAMVKRKVKQKMKHRVECYKKRWHVYVHVYGAGETNGVYFYKMKQQHLPEILFANNNITTSTLRN